MGSVEIGLLLDERYRLVGRRASGATATVWEADDEFLRRRVAIKLLHDHLADDDDLRDRFLAEARTAATVSHPALVAVYDTVTGHPGIVLEWVDGPDLRQRLDQGPIRPDDLVGIATQLCAGLDELHRYGLVHRDVKPANILLTTGGEPKLTDFGITTSNAGDRTATGVVLGTAKYLSPEQVTGDVIDARTDVFALAAVLYEAFAGRAPWVRDGDLPTALARLEEDPPDLRRLQPGIPPGITGAIMRGLARDPDDRWPSAAAFASALLGAELEDGPRPTSEPAPHDQTRPVVPGPVGDTTAVLTNPADPVRADRATTAAAPEPVSEEPARREPVRPPLRRWPRLVGLLTTLGIAVLGWVLITRGGAAGGDGPDDTSPAVLLAATAFDPEGTGPPGEHDELAAEAIDADLTTGWPTERYRSRSFGTKTGVGLIVTIEAERDLTEVAVITDGADDWAAEVYVTDRATAASATSIDAFGERAGGGSALRETATLPLRGRGDTVVIWLTDLGTGPTPIRLRVLEVAIR